MKIDCHTKATCELSCLHGGSFSADSTKSKKGKIIIKCGKKGFSPKFVKASCTGMSRMSKISFDEFELGVSEAKTKCYNTIYEHYNISKDQVHVDCKNNICYVTCRKSGNPPQHIWPDGTETQRTKFICKAKTFWSPARGTMRC